ncbi:MAG: serine/threonine protein kinase [Lachnospiraceae bacterium]|nr:serine/threonine protein kinase [Lachnospiraceae bacterium]
MPDKREYIVKKLNTYNIDVYRCLMDHPVENMPVIYDLSEENGVLTVTEEYIDGVTLKELMDKKGTFHEGTVKKILYDLCTILSDLHELAKPKIIHRDIKPSNIMITRDRVVKLLDINASKFVNVTKSSDTVKMGTPGFAAPEQYGFGVSTVQTDIYALGVLGNYMLTGEVSGRHYISCSLSPVIRRCLMLDPKERFSSAAAMKLAIRNTVKGDYYKKISVSGKAATEVNTPAGDPAGHSNIDAGDLCGRGSDIEPAFYDEYYCRNCGAILNEQNGFDPRDPAWKCMKCGDICSCIEPENGMFWFCDKCKTLLNIQQGFTTSKKRWRCAECGHVSPVR